MKPLTIFLLGAATGALILHMSQMARNDIAVALKATEKEPGFVREYFVRNAYQLGVSRVH